MEDAPILQITVLKGPRNGEILICKPDSTFDVGRVMKGNNLALRDPGISQKHLRFLFIQDDFGWFVTDLDTSNGTKLNGLPIQASVLVRVSDGDVFKIGERTVLGVKIVARTVLDVKGDGNNVPGRRVTRRGGSSGVNIGANSSRVSGEELGLKEAKPKVLTQTRGRKNSDKPISGVEIGKGAGRGWEEAREKLCQKGTGRGKGEIVMKDTAMVLEKEESRDSVMVFCSETEEPNQNGEANVRRNPRRGKSSTVLKEIDGNCVVDSDLGVKEVGMKRKGKGGGRGASSTVLKEDKENGDNLVLKMDIKSSDPDHVVIPEPRKGRRVRRSADSSVVIEEKREEDAEVEDVGVEEGERNSEECRVDLEKMTLREWFDNMDIFLRKAIREESEKAIAILKEKARKFDELLEADTAL